MLLPGEAPCNGASCLHRSLLCRSWDSTRSGGDPGPSFPVESQDWHGRKLAPSCQASPGGTKWTFRTEIVNKGHLVLYTTCRKILMSEELVGFSGLTLDLR
ncbi:hypothetical protein Y1Q_0004073 [Alligator mississippiensis]|uniref:Uncharacterized protein n=1 Tax=Alligator mississippiensis TaxID=8496 RepID=A0A151PI38_ALLMI|nr:hypothetical protein Y1Q_0004073 [Alligator mississippiensis]